MHRQKSENRTDLGHEPDHKQEANTPKPTTNKANDAGQFIRVKSGLSSQVEGSSPSLIKKNDTYYVIVPTTTTKDRPPIHVISPVEKSVNAKSLVKALLSRWASEIKAGNRREAERTLATLVTSTSNPRKNLPKMTQFLCGSQVKVGSEVVKKTKGWKNAGVSRHARKRGRVTKIKDGVATVETERKHTARIRHRTLVDKTGTFYAGNNPNPEP